MDPWLYAYHNLDLKPLMRRQVRRMFRIRGGGGNHWGDGGRGGGTRRSNRVGQSGRDYANGDVGGGMGGVGGASSRAECSRMAAAASLVVVVPASPEQGRAAAENAGDKDQQHNSPPADGRLPHSPKTTAVIETAITSATALSSRWV